MKKLWLASAASLFFASNAIAQHTNHGEHAETPQQSTTTVSVFDQFDTNKDGALSREEYQAFLDASASAETKLTAPLTPIPKVTDADRAAAFPTIAHAHAHGTGVYNYVLVDRLEMDKDSNGAWEASGWVGGDIRKFMVRTEGHTDRSEIESANVELLYHRGVRDWWDVVAGIRQDFGHGPDRSWAAVGVQGLAPYKFEVRAMGYLGQNGRTMAVLEGEYETLFTNRLILQWRSEATLLGKNDSELLLGSGIATASVGARLRYEIHRKFAPYIGIEHERAFGETSRIRRAVGHASTETKAVVGVRVWF